MNSVRGHICEGLKKFQDYSTYDCIPDFTEDGFTRGCDAINYIPIKYCPFCGEKLQLAKLYKIKCKDCGYEYETYSKDEINSFCNECGSSKNIITIEMEE
jgi:rRNA maturation endonuclease Nob1